MNWNEGSKDARVRKYLLEKQGCLIVPSRRWIYAGDTITHPDLGAFDVIGETNRAEHQRQFELVKELDPQAKVAIPGRGVHFYRIKPKPIS